MGKNERATSGDGRHPGGLRCNLPTLVLMSQLSDLGLKTKASGKWENLMPRQAPMCVKQCPVHRLQAGVRDPAQHPKASLMRVPSTSRKYPVTTSCQADFSCLEPTAGHESKRRTLLATPHQQDQLQVHSLRRIMLVPFGACVCMRVCVRLVMHVRMGTWDHHGVTVCLCTRAGNPSCRLRVK